MTGLAASGVLLMTEESEAAELSNNTRLPLWRHVAISALCAVLVAVGATMVLAWLFTDQWRIWDIPPVTGAEAPSPEFGLPGAVRIALLIVAGFGGIVGLVVAYRRQRLLEVDAQGQRDATRLFTERFGAAANQLGDESAVTRLAGVYAMASLADEWEQQRQQCVDVLCAYIRLPFTSEQHDTDTPRRTIAARKWRVRQWEHKEETTTENRKMSSGLRQARSVGLYEGLR